MKDLSLRGPGMRTVLQTLLNSRLRTASGDDPRVTQAGG